jgi:MFS family permease
VIQYPNIYVLLGCRVMQGFFIGNYMAIVPIYINELAPKQIVGSFGVFTQLLVVIALVVSYALGLIFTAVDVGPFTFFRLMVGINAIFIILQSILLLVNYVPESPNSLIAKNKNE